uniref:Uncharacterized protein n=1 Tax=Cacopsylla melanoneura TaxID=428564 RepID=A0A8D8WTL2_9HEMI
MFSHTLLAFIFFSFDCDVDCLPDFGLLLVLFSLESLVLFSLESLLLSSSSLSIGSNRGNLVSSFSEFSLSCSCISSPSSSCSLTLVGKFPCSLSLASLESFLTLPTS